MRVWWQKRGPEPLAETARGVLRTNGSWPLSGAIEGSKNHLGRGPRMTVWDYAVLVAYFLTMVGLGVWAMRRVQTQEDYFMGGRSFGKLSADVGRLRSRHRLERSGHHGTHNADQRHRWPVECPVMAVCHALLLDHRGLVPADAPSDARRLVCRAVRIAGAGRRLRGVRPPVLHGLRFDDVFGHRQGGGPIGRYRHVSRLPDSSLASNTCWCRSSVRSSSATVSWEACGPSTGPI